MKWFDEKKAKEKYIVIVGCGRLGANLANAWSEGGGDVVIIDKDKNAFQKLSSSYGGLNLEGDATDLDILLEAQLSKANYVVLVTNNDNVNIMVAQLAKEWFSVKRVICRLYDPERECVYQELGIDTICPAILSAKEIGKLIGQKKEAV